MSDLLRSVTDDRTAGEDAVTGRILDAAGELFARHGVRRCTVEDIAEHSGLGRTTVYRRFDGRAQIVTAVLARDCRRFFTSIVDATAHLERIEDKVVEGFLTGLGADEAALLSSLARTEPELLHLVTVDSGPLIAVAREFLVGAFGPVVDGEARRRVAVAAEVLVRLAVSLVVDGRSVIPLDDAARAREDLHALFDPLLGPLADLRTGDPGAAIPATA
jgi:AcrR family transcriptional regulator